jgi:hypothetical protein
MAIDSGPGVGVVQKLLDKVYVLYSNETSLKLSMGKIQLFLT